MATKLWVFGDSFSTYDMPPSKDNPTGKVEHPSWIALTCKGLDISESTIYADYGVSNDWIFHQFIENMHQMDTGDYVIIQPTQKHRQWFFEEPSLANYWLKDLEKHVSKEEKNAVEAYVTYLQNDRLDDLRYVQFGLALERLSQMAQHLRILVLPGFFGVTGVTGTLISICDGEFADVNVVGGNFYQANGGIDPRLNHMSAENHEILANKVVEFFTNGTTIDLTTGFKTGFIK